MAAPKFNALQLGGLNVWEAPEGTVGLNRFVCRSGASRYGRGVFCMIRKDYNTLKAGGGGGGGGGSGGSSSTPYIQTLTMKGDPGPGISMPVIVAGAEPMLTGIKQDQGDNDLLKVTVYDFRAQNYTAVHKAYNVLVQGFPLDASDKPICYQSTLTSGSGGGAKIPWTWHDLLIDAEIIANPPGDLPAWTPYNLVWDNVPSSRALDDAAAQLFYIVGFNPFDKTGPGASNYSLFAPGTGFPSNTSLYQGMPPGALLSGQAPNTPRAAERNLIRFPKSFDVIFPGVGGNDPYDHRQYRSLGNDSGIDTAAGTPNGILQVGSQIAVWNGTAWVNQSDLDVVAADLAMRAGKFISQDYGQAEFAGIWPFQPDGVYRQVEWISDKNGARTILKSDNARDWLPTDQLNDPINLTAPQEVIGLGGMGDSIGPGGVNYVYPPARQLYILTGQATKPGTYTMKPIRMKNQIDATVAGQFTNANIGTGYGSNVYGINVNEAEKSPTAASQWDLDTTNTYQPQIVYPIAYFGPAGDGVDQYLISVRQGKFC
jgi:hypothetical protein